MDSKKSDNANVILVLSGGGAKGVALAGALVALEENGIPIDRIVGCSIGSFIGALYAYYGNAVIVADKSRGVKTEDLIDIPWYNYYRLFLSNKGLTIGKNFEQILSHQLSDIDIKDLDIPMSIITTDLDTLELYEICEGNLITAVRASCALPPYFAPVKFHNKLLIDGGIASPLPTEIAQKYSPKVIISINLSSYVIQKNNNSMVNIMLRMLEGSYYNSVERQEQLADIAIKIKLPVGVTDTVHNEVLYHEGYVKTLETIPEIKKMLEKHKIDLKSLQKHEKREIEHNIRNILELRDDG